METLKIHETKITAIDGTPIRLVYDEENDNLEIFFGENEKATGVELTDHILLRLNRNTGRPVSLMIQNFSVLTEQTEFGPRSFALNKLDDLPDDLRILTFRLIKTMPVCQYLKMSQFQVSPLEWLPLTYVEFQPNLMTA